MIIKTKEQVYNILPSLERNADIRPELIEFVDESHRKVVKSPHWETGGGIFLYKNVYSQEEKFVDISLNKKEVNESTWHN